MSEPLRLLVVRHAIAEQRDARRWPRDAARPLTARGIDEFERALPGITALCDRVRLAWTSPLLRASHTARLGSAAGNWPPAHETALLRPRASPDELGRALRAHARGAAAAEVIALIGHEPGLSRFTAWCLGATTARGLELRKGGALQLRFERGVRRGGARLDWLATPRLLRQLGRNGR